MKKVSIIIPVYNTVKQLEKCLNSICNQTYPNLEIICIDDGSTDGSEKIVDKFAGRDNRIVVIHQPNGGESNARNAGLLNMTGDYVGFMDCDDWIESNMYEDLVKVLEEKNVDMAASAYYKESDTDCVQVTNEVEIEDKVFGRDELLYYVYKRESYRGFSSYIWCKLYRREVLDDVGLILFDESLKMGGDILYFARIALNIKNVYYIPKAYYHYYQRSNSAFHSNSFITRQDHLRAYVKIIDCFTSVGIGQDIILWVKRFLAYHASCVAELACTQENSEVLKYCQSIMLQYKKEYCDTNIDSAERIERYEGLLNKVVSPNMG